MRQNVVLPLSGNTTVTKCSKFIIITITYFLQFYETSTKSGQFFILVHAIKGPSIGSTTGSSNVMC